MTKHRMKCAVDDRQVTDRLSYRPEIMEFHLTEADLIGEKKDALCRQIERVQRTGASVYLHHPMRYRGTPLDILTKDPDMQRYYEASCRVLHTICQSYQIQCVLHCHYAGTESSKTVSKEKTSEMKKAVESILAYSGDSFLWENTIEGVFSYDNPYLLDTLIRPLCLPLVHDISHTFISLKGDNDALEDVTKTIDPYVHYLHVVDSLGGVHDGLALGEGLVDWVRLYPYIHAKPFIYEIGLEDVADATPMARSATYFEQLKHPHSFE